MLTFWLLLYILQSIEAHKCWIKSTTKPIECEQGPETQTQCKPAEKTYKHEFTCCAQEFYTDPTGFQVRKCMRHRTAKYTVRDEFKHFKAVNPTQNRTLNGGSKPEIREWISPVTNKPVIAIMLKMFDTNGNAGYYKHHEAYSDYIGDKLTYETLAGILKDPLMQHFENKINRNNNKQWQSYYHQYFYDLKPWKYDKVTADHLSVANIMEFALIFWIDFIMMNNDRMDFEFEVDDDAYLQFKWFTNNGNLMIHPYINQNFIRLFPIDNSAMAAYIEFADENELKYGTEHTKTFLQKRLAFFKSIIENTNQRSLWWLAEKFVNDNYQIQKPNRAHVGTKMIPNGVNKKLVTKIVYNTWYNYGADIASGMVMALKTRTKDIKEDIILGRSKDATHFYKLYLSPVLALAQKMPKKYQR